MKTRFLICAGLIIAFAAVAFGQVKVTPEKVVYERKGADVIDFKKKFEIIYPRFSGVDKDVLQQLNGTFDYWRVFSTSLEEETDFQWLYEMTYTVNYNKNGIVELTMTRSGVGAYPSDFSKTIVADAGSGMRVQMTDAFKNRIGLLTELDKRQSEEMKAAEKAYKADGGEGNLFDEYVPKASDQVEQFSVSDKGVTFLFDYEFAHVRKALQPEGRYFFSWNEIEPFLNDYSSIRDLLEKVRADTKIVPILDLKIGGVLGGVKDGKFVDALTASKEIDGKGSFVVFKAANLNIDMNVDNYNAAYKGQLASDQPDDICPDFRYIEVSPKMKQGTAIGNGGNWNPVPNSVTELSNENPVYKNAVANFLKTRGLNNPVVKIAQIYKVDLEGDGADEIVIRATNYKHSKNELIADLGGYSFVMVRKIVSGKVKDILLAGDFVDSEHPGAENKHEISSILDLNGDGKMEVVVYGEYYEGAWVSVYGIENGAAKPLLETGCGL